MSLRRTYFILLMVLPAGLFAQRARIITLEHPVYPVLERLQQRGYLDGLSPNRLPWSFGDVDAALTGVDTTALTPVERVWFRQAKAAMASFGHTGVSASLQAGGFGSNYLRNDPLRASHDHKGLMPAAIAQARFVSEQVAVQAGMTFDRYYDADPDGIDVARRLYTRSENGYAAWKGRFAQVSMGRFAQHWTGFSAPGVVVSRNPVPFDHVAFSAGTRTLQVSSLLGELDMLGGDGTFTERERHRMGIKRYLALHRLDWRPDPRLQFTVFEGVLYSSPSAGPSLAYLNPAQIYLLESDNDPKNFENNLVFGGLFWGRFRKMTVQAQLLLDDGVYQDRAARRTSGQLEPASYASMAQLTASDLFPAVDVQFTAHRVSNLAYRTDQMEGQWSYAQRGLASNFSDFIHRRMQISWHAFRFLEGFTLTGYAEGLQQGAGDFRLPLANDAHDAGNPPSILSGVIERTVRGGVMLHYQPAMNLVLRLDAGHNRVENRFHLEGRDASYGAWLLSGSWRFH